jgi:hypothetical protein
MWSSLTLESPDPPTTLRDRLAVALTEQSPFFAGKVRDATFKLTRKLVLFERTLPIAATGRLEPAQNGGTLVYLRTRPALISLTVIGFITISCIWSAIMQWRGGTNWFAPYFFGGVVLFMLLVTFINTTIEERRYCDELTRIFVSARKRHRMT